MFFSVTEYDGLIGLIDIESYEGFVSEYWTNELMIKHLIKEMKARHILIWAGDIGGGTYDINVNFDNKNSLETLVGTIEVTTDKLYFIDYNSLTFAAEYKDYILPQWYFKDKYIALEKGMYDCEIKRLLNEDDIVIGFDINFEKVNVNKKSWENIPWLNFKLLK